MAEEEKGNEQGDDKEQPRDERRGAREDADWRYRPRSDLNRWNNLTYSVWAPELDRGRGRSALTRHTGLSPPQRTSDPVLADLSIGGGGDGDDDDDDDGGGGATAAAAVSCLSDNAAVAAAPSARSASPRLTASSMTVERPQDRRMAETPARGGAGDEGGFNGSVDDAEDEDTCSGAEDDEYDDYDRPSSGSLSGAVRVSDDAAADTSATSTTGTTPTALSTKRPRGRPRKHPLLSPDAQARIAKGRSKTGCITCRRRKKKCDETKPQCTSNPVALSSTSGWRRT